MLVSFLLQDKGIMEKSGNVVPCKYVLASSLAQNFYMENHLLSLNVSCCTKHQTTFLQGRCQLEGVKRVSVKSSLYFTLVNVYVTLLVFTCIVGTLYAYFME